MEAFEKFEPKKPTSGNWELLPDEPDFIKKIQGYRYLSPLGIRVISSVHIVENLRDAGHSPHYHISLSDNGKRIPASIVDIILKQFDATDFEEDNHAPLKIIRSFWKPVERPAEVCPCKDNEKPEVDGDYIWREDNNGKTKTE